MAGIAVDEGAEALLARRPEGTGLIRAAGLAGQLAAPGTTAARIWSRNQLVPLPRRQVMGIPADLDDLARSRLLSAAGLTRAREDLGLPATRRAGDVDVASYVGARFGPELVDRLVDPLLAGVYAGRSEDLSFEATLPGLAEESRRHASLAEAAGALMPPPAPAPGAAGAAAEATIFTTLTGGLGTLPAAVAAASGAEVLTRAMVREMERTPGGWRLTVGSAHAPESLDADAVVLAVPGQPAARLLAGLPGAADARAALAGIAYASMAIVTLAYPVSSFPRPLEGSGYLVPAVDGHPVKAVTFSSVKWPHLRSADPAMAVVRCSLGRVGEERLLQRDDADLARLAAADLAAATGVRGEPADVRVTRWGGAPAPVHRRPPEPGGADPRRRGPRARPGRVRGRLRRDRDPGLHRHRPRRGHAGAPLPAREQARRCHRRPRLTRGAPHRQDAAAAQAPHPAGSGFRATSGRVRLSQPRWWRTMVACQALMRIPRASGSGPAI